MSLKNKAVKGVVWNSLGTIGAGLLQLLLTVILARLLSPSDFGLVEILLVFTIISQTFVDSGYSQALIRDKEADQKDLSTVFFFNLIVSAMIYVLLFSLSPAIADFYNDSSLVDLSRFVFTVILFNAFSIIQTTTYSKTLNFKPIAIANIFPLLISGTVSIWMAYNNFGVWSIAMNLVLFALFKTLVLWGFSSWRPSPDFSISSLKKYFKFGGYLLINGLLDKIVSNLESLTIGRIYSKADLGFFSQARKLETYLMQTPAAIVQKVTYPTLSTILDDRQRLKSAYRRLLQVNLFFTIPLSLFVVVEAENVISFFLGNQWLSAALYLKIWMIVGLLVGFYSLFINIFMVLGETKKLFRIGLLRQCLRIISVIIFVRFSVTALLIGVLLVTLCSVVLYISLGRKLIDYQISELFKDTFPIFIFSLVAAAFVSFVHYFLVFSNSFFALVISAILMISLYLGLMSFFKVEAFSEVIDIYSLVKRKKSSKTEL